MSPSDFDNEQDDLESLTLTDQLGRSLDCYIEHSLEYGRYNYLLLQPMDLPVMIIAWNEEKDDDDFSEAIIVDNDTEIEEIFADAKAVLAELDLTLKHTAFTLTASGELPPLEDEDVVALDLSEDYGETAAEELQFLASFYHLEEKYTIYTPLAPLLFVAREDRFKGTLELVSPEDEEIKPILEELLFDELE